MFKVYKKGLKAAAPALHGGSGSGGGGGGGGGRGVPKYRSGTWWRNDMETFSVALTTVR